MPKKNPIEKRDHTDAVSALKGAVETLGLPVDAKAASAEASGNEVFTLKQTSGAVSDPEARLVYFQKADGSLVLSWRVETDISENWLLTYVDADNGKDILGVVDYVSEFATMEVFPWNVIDPSQGSRRVVEDPWNIDASPYTWFGDGSQNYTTTRGNNAIAHINPDGGSDYLNNYRPDSPQRQFEYPYSDTVGPKEYIDFSITQLFYTANNYHDVLYQLGFDEAAGNFQANNNGKGGQDNDFVVLNSQDGSGTNNARFGTPPDGSNGRMLMFIWTSANPNRDSSLDSGVVLHEYTHGCKCPSTYNQHPPPQQVFVKLTLIVTLVSTRLTGGPSNSNCLRTTESGGMGEGWSDFMAIAYATKPSEDRTAVNRFGNWISNRPNGIRKYPYATDMSINPHTYAKADQESGVHAVGNVWGTILYEVLWNLIDKHGNEGEGMPQLNNGVPTDGRFLAMKLVMDGMALQPCSPTMPQARDAILDADKALTGGSNACELWTGFAKRGLGEGARYGFFGRRESFRIPSGVC